MEYLFLFFGIIASIAGLAVLWFIAKLLWNFGEYLKNNIKFVWYFYVLFWALLLLFVVASVAVGAFDYFQKSKKDKARERFIDENKQLIDKATKEYINLSYILDGRPSDLTKCMSAYQKLKSNYNADDSFYYSVEIEVENLSYQKKISWNNLDKEQQKQIRLKALDCKKSLGKLTDEDYQREKIVIQSDKISRSAVKEELKKLIDSGMDERDAMEKLMHDSEFKYHLQQMAKKFENKGSLDPIGSIGNLFDIDASKRAKRSREMEKEWEEQDKKREAEFEAMLKKNKIDTQLQSQNLQVNYKEKYNKVKDKLNKEYEQLELSGMTDESTVKWQKAWIVERNKACGKDTKCLYEWTEARLPVLQKLWND